MEIEMEQALRLIIAKSPNATSQALQCLAAIRAKSPVLQLRYNQCIQLALNDPAATWTADDRSLLAQYLDSGADDNRSYMLSVRLSIPERDYIQQQADAAGLSLSNWIRERILG